MEDSKIVALLFERDEKGLFELERSHKKRALSLAADITANCDDAEECWNDTCLAVWNTIPPTRPLSLKAYVLRIIRNFALSIVKKRSAAKRPQVVAELDECVAIFEPSSNEPDDRELDLILEEFLSSLPKNEAAIFMRRYFYSEPVNKIAVVFGVSENHISKILAKLRKKLRAKLEEGGINP